MPGKSKAGDGGLSAGPEFTVIPGSALDDLLDFSDATDPLHINGGDGDDTILGGSAGDSVNAGDGDDRITGNAGDDTVHGGDGYDTAVYGGSILGYLWAPDRGGVTTVWDIDTANGNDGIDQLKQIEALEFGDYTFVFGGDNAALVLGEDVTTDEDSGVSVSFDAYDFDNGTVSLVSYSVTGDHAADGSATLSLDATTAIAQGMGVGESYELSFDPGSAYQYLAVGESVQETVTITVSDGQGNTTVSTAVITIEGRNDAPTITGVLYDRDAVEEDGTLFASGSVQATDPDASDVLSFSAPGGGVGTYGSVAMDPGGTWTYTLANGSLAVQSLAEGVTVFDTISVMVSDGNGGNDSVDIVIQVTGDNDAPEFGAVVYNQTSVTEDTSLIATGTALASDIDIGDLLSYSVQGGGAGDYGSIAIDASGNWTYTLNNDLEEVQNLNAGDSLTDSFVFVVDDGNGGNDTVAVSVDIMGQDDSGTPPSLLTFEGFSSLAAGYGGLDWSAGWVLLNPANLGGGGRDGIESGYDDALVSGAQVAFNAGGGDVEIMGTDFDLESVWMAAAWRDGLTVEVSAWDDGVLLGTQTIVLQSDSRTQVLFDDALFDNVDLVVFHASGGTNPGYPGDGTHFAMDNLLVIL